ncbi:hypothetical protein HDG33_006786 [Paraburkholderia sp. Cpub6]|nr:hypothetical protein [Paraburkholderia sp. Cpub6]
MVDVRTVRRGASCPSFFCRTFGTTSPHGHRSRWVSCWSDGYRCGHILLLASSYDSS